MPKPLSVRLVWLFFIFLVLEFPVDGQTSNDQLSYLKKTAPKTASRPTTQDQHYSKCTSWFRPGVYIRHMLGQKLPATAFVIGANVGAQKTDVSWQSMLAIDELNKVFVEPLPFFHKKLEANVKQAKMKNAVCLNAAVSSSMKELTVYCTGINEDGSIKDGFPWFVTEICSSTPERMESSYDLARNVPIEMIRQHTTKYTVPAIPTVDLIREYSSNGPVNYIQIDVEGIDHEVSAHVCMHLCTRLCIAFDCYLFVRFVLLLLF
jgi:FkbM family methyltransferase